jgi:hypothetical protein
MNIQRVSGEREKKRERERERENLLALARPSFLFPRFMSVFYIGPNFPSLIMPQHAFLFRVLIIYEEESFYRARATI